MTLYCFVVRDAYKATSRPSRATIIEQLEYQGFPGLARKLTLFELYLIPIVGQGLRRSDNFSLATKLSENTKNFAAGHHCSSSWVLVMLFKDKHVGSCDHVIEQKQIMCNIIRLLLSLPSHIPAHHTSCPSFL